MKLNLAASLSTVFDWFRRRALVPCPTDSSLDTEQHDLLNESSGGAIANRFAAAASRLAASEHYQPSTSAEMPYGFFRGRHIIGEQAAIHGGIFVGHAPHEAIVVDEKYGDLTRVYNEVKTSLQEEKDIRGDREFDLFRKVVQACQRIIRYVPNDESWRDSITEQLEDDEKIALDVFVARGKGLPRHQVLLGAYLLEKLRSDKLLDGTPTIDSALIPEAGSEALLYYSAHGQIFRFDPHARAIANQMH